MASYKIYFLDFFHEKYPSTAENRQNKLQNAISRAYFAQKAESYATTATELH